MDVSTHQRWENALILVFLELLINLTLSSSFIHFLPFDRYCDHKLLKMFYSETITLAIQDRRKLYQDTKKLVAFIFNFVWSVCEHPFMWSKNQIHLVVLKVGVHTLQMIVLQQIMLCIY